MVNVGNEGAERLTNECSSGIFPSCVYCQHYFRAYWTLKMKTLRSFETSSSYYCVTQRHMPEERNPHVSPLRIRWKDINKENWPEIMIRFSHLGKGPWSSMKIENFFKNSATSILRKRSAEVKNDLRYSLLFLHSFTAWMRTFIFTFTSMNGRWKYYYDRSVVGNYKNWSFSSLSSHIIIIFILIVTKLGSLSFVQNPWSLLCYFPSKCI